MQIVIEIDDDMYKSVIDNDAYVLGDVDWILLENAIANGTPLPKNHGRLKDIDAFITKVKADRKHSAYLRSWTADDVLNALANSYAPTIIEGRNSE